MFTNMVDYLQLYGASFELTKAYIYNKLQDFSKSYCEDGPNYMCFQWWLLPTNDILKILHSVTPMVPTPPGFVFRYMSTKPNKMRNNKYLGVYHFLLTIQ